MTGVATWLRRLGLLPVARRVPAYARLGWGLARDRRLSAGQRVLLVGGLGYLLSPIDLVPGFIPVLGQMDDMTVMLWAMRRVLRGLPVPERDEHLRRAGLDLATVDADLASLRRAARLLAGLAAAFTGRVAAGAGTLAWRGIRRLLGRA